MIQKIERLRVIVIYGFLLESVNGRVQFLVKNKEVG